jgi:hypothetical protein
MGDQTDSGFFPEIRWRMAFLRAGGLLGMNRSFHGDFFFSRNKCPKLVYILRTLVDSLFKSLDATFAVREGKCG